MATFYCDYEGGNDANAGTTFALRWKTLTLGATAARIAPGDVIRVMGSPDPTSLGQTAKWTNGPLQATKAISSSTNATPIVVTLTGASYTSMAPSVGDTVIVNGHTTNTGANGVWKISAANGSTTITLANADGTNSVGNGVGGATGTVRKIANCVVELTTAVTRNIAVCGNQGAKGNWTATANVTTTVATTGFKEGGGCQQIVVAAGFTTGRAAYFPTGLLDLSAYQQVSFWFYQTSGTLGAANSVSLKLCSDTAGVTAVNTVNIPALSALNQFSPITVDLAANLGSAIQSIALYVNTDNGAQSFTLDNIIACKAAGSADSLSLTSLVGKNTDDEMWWGIQSINGTRVMLDATVNTKPDGTPPRGYVGTTETVTTYKRETTKTNMAAATTTVVQSVMDSGISPANLITYSGGWNRTDMSTQTGETWFDGQNGFGYGVSYGAKSYVHIDKINLTRYNIGLHDGGGGFPVSTGTAHVCNTTDYGFFLGSATGSVSTLLTANATGANFGGIVANASVNQEIRVLSSQAGGVSLGASSSTGIIVANNCGTTGTNLGVNSYVASASISNGGSTGLACASSATVGSLTSNTNMGYGINVGVAYGTKILGGSTSGNSTAISMGAGSISLRNFVMGEATETAGATAFSRGRVFSENHDNTSGYSKIFCEGGVIETQGTTVHGSASRAWKFSPTSSNIRVAYPLNQPIARAAVGANTLVTVSVWVQRTNVNLICRLMCGGNQIAGVSSDVLAVSTAAINTWEHLTITFTPTEAGVVEIEAQAYPIDGATTYSGYFSDMSISQA